MLNKETNKLSYEKGDKGEITWRQTTNIPVISIPWMENVLGEIEILTYVME